MQKRFRPEFNAVLLCAGLLSPVSVPAADAPMKLACKYDSAALSDSGKEKGYAIDCRNVSDERCPMQHFVLDDRWKTEGDNSVMNEKVTSGLGESSVQTTTVNRATLEFTFRWELASRDRPPPVLSGQGKCVPEK